MADQTRFTDRERAVIDLLKQAKSNKQIAFALGVSVRTVEFHLTRIYTKLAVASRAEAILRLAENHRWESTVDLGEPRSKDTPSPESTRRIPMRALAYVAAVSLTIVLAVLLFFTNAPTTTPGPQITPHPSPMPTAVGPSPPPPATQPAATPQAAASIDFMQAPLETSSPTGATVRLNQFETGTDCLRLELLVMGIKGPPDAPPDFEPPAPITEIALFEPGSDVALLEADLTAFAEGAGVDRFLLWSPVYLTPIGGGGGGAPASDGTFMIGTVHIYRLGSSLPQRPVQLLVKLSLDESLGFVEPVSFPAQSSVGPSQDCGL